MAILKIVKDEYKNTDVVDNLCNYLLDKNKMLHMCYGGTGVMLSDPATSMHMAKNLLGQTTGKQVEHFILAFNEYESAGLTANIERLTMFAYEVCAFFNGTQTLFSLHEINNLHFHFIVNTINPYTNKMLWLNYNNEFDFQKYITQLLHTQIS